MEEWTTTPRDLFTRQPFRDGERILVRSTCTCCGTSFLGSVMEGLCEWERQHRCLHKERWGRGASTQINLQSLE